MVRIAQPSSTRGAEEILLEEELLSELRKRQAAARQGRLRPHRAGPAPGPHRAAQQDAAVPGPRPPGDLPDRRLHRDDRRPDRQERHPQAAHAARTSLANAQTYAEQVFKVLDRDAHRGALQLASGSSTMTAADMIQLAAQHTVARMLERDDFAKRYAAQQPIAIHEFLYPLVQGYDSVALQGRRRTRRHRPEVQPADGPRPAGSTTASQPQIVLTMPLLEGLDGVQQDVQVARQLHRHRRAGDRHRSPRP